MVFSKLEKMLFRAKFDCNSEQRYFCSTVKGPGCGALLTDGIVGNTIQVTTSFNASFNENHALLNSSNAWCSSILNSGQYLLVSLGEK